MKSLKYFMLLFFILFEAVSCGNKKEEKSKDGFTYEKTTDSTSKTETDSNEVVLTGNDAMQFNKTEIRVKAGEKVKLTLTHVGKMSKNVMGHNFVLLKQGVNLTAFGNKAATSAATEYVPKDAANDIIAYTKLIGGGETTVIEFNAPEIGEYEFLCSFPGHYAMMKGKFIVE
jgi:azurin